MCASRGVMFKYLEDKFVYHVSVSIMIKSGGVYLVSMLSTKQGLQLSVGFIAVAVTTKRLRKRTSVLARS